MSPHDESSTPDDPDGNDGHPRGLGRRRFLVGAGSAVAVGAGGALVGTTVLDSDDEPAPAGPARAAARETFVGRSQPGIASERPRHAIFAAFDLDPGPEADPLDTCRELLAEWTAVGERIMAGKPPGAAAAGPDDQAPSSGIDDGLDPAGLSVTVGLGPGLFPRIGRADAAPARLAELPAFDGDQLQDRWSGGDLLVQLCSDDLQVLSAAFVAFRSQTPGRATLRWTQAGFVSPPGDGGTPRNMLGQKDGTANPEPGSQGFDEAVWATEGEPEWFAGGTYLVFRKIRVDLAGWSLATPAGHDASTGRRRDDGTPLSGGSEHTPVDLDARGPDGELLVPEDSHVRLVHGKPMLRRPYNYDYGFLASDPVTPAPADDGHDHSHGEPGGHDMAGHDRYDAGLLFVAFVRDVALFTDAQTALAGVDQLNQFLTHTGSAIFAIPPGTPDHRTPLAAALFT